MLLNLFRKHNEFYNIQGYDDIKDIVKRAVLSTLLAAIYEDELIEEPHSRETIISNIERQKEQLLVNFLGPR